MNETLKFDWSSTKVGDIVVLHFRRASVGSGIYFDYNVLGRVVLLDAERPEFSVVEAIYFKTPDETEYKELSQDFKNRTGIGLNSGVTGGSTTRIRMDFCNFLDSVRDASDAEKEFVELTDATKKFGI